MDYARNQRKNSFRGSNQYAGNDHRRSHSGLKRDDDPVSMKSLALSVAAFILFLTSVLFLQYYWREMRWRYIVVHHTASDVGNLDYYRRIHMQEKGWPDIAYHFLINNGNSNTAVGQIESSELWEKRSYHYSTKVSWINYFGIAVVLVGNFDSHEISLGQRESLINLLARLSRKYDIPVERIVGHREIWSTKCPGKHLNMIEVRRDVAQLLTTERMIK